MTKNFLGKAMGCYINLYQSNIAKSTVQNYAETYNTCDQGTFLRYLLLPKEIGGEVGIRISWVKNF